jgi:hypothetical protein
LQEGGRRRRKRPARVAVGDGAPAVLRRRERAKWMQLDVGVIVVASFCSEDA